MDKTKYEVKLDNSFNAIGSMDNDTIIKEFKILGCPLSLEEIQNLLNTNYNELAIGDMIFNTYEIDDTNSKYAKELIDLGLVQIAKNTNDYGFMHYGIFIEEVDKLSTSEISDVEKVKALEQLFNQFFKMCKVFKIDNLDGLLYQVNDGFDLQILYISYLDEVMELARTDKQYVKMAINFIERFYKQFTQINPLAKFNLDIEYAHALIVSGSSKGNQMFEKLINEYSDKSELIIRYASCYLDVDAKRFNTIIKRYEKHIDKTSEEYALIQEVMEDLRNGTVS